jgi:PIN domain nuclease of toxin-antitoxin system
MRVLLDTQLLLWTYFHPERLSPAAVRVLSNGRNELCFSAASIWEIAIKSGLSSPAFCVDVNLLRSHARRDGYEEIAILGSHALTAGELPRIHKDPFDRLLIAQAVVEGIPLLTVDARIGRYPGPIRRI